MVLLLTNGELEICIKGKCGWNTRLGTKAWEVGRGAAGGGGLRGGGGGGVVSDTINYLDFSVFSLLSQ